jgi:hypothetical protein
MKKLIVYFAFLALIISPGQVFASSNDSLAQKFKGRILLQAENKGQLWYIHPVTLERYYLGTPISLFKTLKAVSLGISNKNFNGLKKAGLTKLSGRVLLKVEDAGKAFYINPKDLKLYYLGSPDAAFKLMRSLALGISDKNVVLIKINKNNGEPASTKSVENKPAEDSTPPPPVDNQDSQATTTATTTPEDNAGDTTPPPVIATGTEACEFLAEYFNNKNLSWDSVATATVPSINFDWGVNMPAELTVNNKFSVRWTGKCDFTGGKYKFTAVFDDAMRVFIDGENFLQSWADNDRTITRYNEREIAAGEHEIKVEYYEYYRNAVAKLSWEKME